MIFPSTAPPASRLRPGWLITGVLLIVGLLAALWWRSTNAAPPFFAPNPVTAAWEKAKAAGSYHFTSDVLQETIPVASITNVGRRSRTDAFHLVGQNDLRNQTLELTLWNQGGSVLNAESGVSLRTAGGKTYARRGQGEWQETDTQLDTFAPQGDFLGYLAAIRNISPGQSETRNDITFTRYTFELNGPAFADIMHEQLTTALRAKGELPAGVQLEPSAYYQAMTGSGELWVGANGLPLRQILHLRFPEQHEERVEAHMTVDFARYGVEQSTLLTLLRTGQWQGAWLVLPERLPDLTGLWLGLTLSLAALLVVRYRRVRTVQIALVTAVIVSQIVGPVLSAVSEARFFDNYRAQAAAQEEKQTTAANERAIQSAVQRGPEFNAHRNPLATGDTRHETGDMRVETGNLIQESTLQSSVSSLQAAPAAQATDPGTDTDGDTLTDFTEARIDTSPADDDTDGDILNDNVEVAGFTLGGQSWYLNPNATDSNLDGQSDGLEWGNNSDGTLRSTPLDTDSDGLPDLFDPDNDNDGVPDHKDIAVFSKGNTTLSESAPLQLTLNNLMAGKPTMVEFQLRPQDAQQLWFAFNVLDWPQDSAGQMQDVDGVTYADLAASQGRTPDGSEENGDMKLLPMLEIRIPTASANLPPQSELTPFNITVNDFTADGATKVAYVPLTIVADERNGERVAFSGQMRYQPTGSWPAPHSVRLAWVVQALVDQPCDTTVDTSADCQADGLRNNVPTVVQSYYSDWTLTGLNVHEEHGTDTAIVYEDPAVDTNLQDDPALWALAFVLDGHFVNARDANNDTVRDLKLADFPARFDRDNNPSPAQRFEIPNLLQVATQSYSTVDQAAVYTIMTDTVRILNDHFVAPVDGNRTIKPMLLFVQESNQRGMGLDLSNVAGAYVTQSGAALSLDMAPSGQPAQEVSVYAAVKWQAYCARATGAVAFTPCSTEDYWDVLEARYANLPSLPGDEDSDWVGARLALAQIYYTSLQTGYLAAVQSGNQIVTSDFALEDENNTITAVRSSLLSLAVVPSIAAENIGRIFPGYIPGSQSFRAYVHNYGKTLRSHLVYIRNLALTNPATTNVNADPDVVKARNQIRLFKLAKVGAAAAAVMVLGQLALLWPGLPREARIAIGSLTVALTAGLTVILPAIGLATLKAATHPTDKLANKLVYGRLAKIGGIIGGVISVAAIWGFFAYAAATSGLAPGDPALIRAAVEALVTTIITILLIVLASNPIGAIISAILGLVDLILTLICETGTDELRQVPGLGGACFTITGAITKAVTGLIYNYELMVDLRKDDLMVTGAPGLTLTDPTKGFVAGNPFTLTLPVTTTLHHQEPGTDEGGGPIILSYPYLFSADNLKSSTFRYKLFDPASESGATAVDLNQMSSDWQNVVVEDTAYGISLHTGQAATSPAPRGNNTLPAGINVKLSTKLGMSYAVPAYECWTLLVIPVCYVKEYEGSTSEIPLDSIRYDVFPATLAEFLTLGNQPGPGGALGRGLGWDPSFGALADSDGDGLRGTLFNGLDPDDTTWDADGDGLGDIAELQIRQAGVGSSPILRDTDNDGLTDAQESAFGTNPAIADSDNDGLTDGVEIRHQVVGADGKPTATWAGGWQVTINSSPARTIWVSSNPANADGDQDGVSDQAERGLAGQLDNQNRPYHPNVYNTAPLAVVTASSDPDGYLAPNQSFRYTSTVIANVPVAPGVLNVTAPAVLGSAPNPAALPFDSLTFSNSQTVTVASNLAVAANATTQGIVLTSTATTRLPSSGASWTWGTLTNDQLPPISAPFIMRDSAVTVSRPDRGDSYLFSGQSVNTSAVNNDVPGHFPGDLFAYTVPGGVTRQLDQDTDDLQSRFGQFTPLEANGAFLRGKTNPSVACNNAGQCMVVWEHLVYCHSVTINGINVVSTGDEPLVEPLVFLARDPNDNNPLDGGFEEIWRPLTSLGTGFHTGGDINPLPYTVAFCGKTNLYVSEYDSGDISYIGPDPTLRDWTGMNFLGWHTLDPLEWNVAKLLDYDDFGGYDFKLSVTQGVPASGQHRVIAAAMLAPDGTITKPQFQISPVRDALANEAISDANFNPVVTSDGSNFLVAWESLARASGFKSGINARLFDGAGNALTGDQPDLDQVTLDTSGATGGVGAITQSYANLAAIWADDHYIVTRQMIQRTGVTYSNPDAITSRQIDGNGAYVAGSTTTLATGVATDARESHGLAWDPAHRNALLVYTEPTGPIKALVFGQDNAGPLFVDFGFQPQAAYHPASQSWLISYNGGGLLGFRQFSTNLGASFVSGTPPIYNNNLTTNNLACPAPTSAPVIDLRFEELPGATIFADSSGYGNDADCAERGCPATGFPGAPNAPLSDYAVKFNRLDPRLTVHTAFADSFTLAMWIKAPSIGADEAYFVEQAERAVGTASDWSLGMSNGLLRLKLGGQVLTSPGPRIDNDQWHFVTVTRDKATGKVALYVDGVLVASSTLTTNRLTNAHMLYIGGDFFNVRPFGGLIDHLQLFGVSLAADAVQALFNRTGQSYCVAGGAEGPGARDNIYWTRLQLNQQDTRGGRIAASGALRLQVDADKPTASITSVSNNAVVGAGQVIGGSASDTRSGVGQVEVSVNNGAWQPAVGANTWSFSLAGLSGDVDLRVRATDNVGNIGDPSAVLRVRIDATAPIVSIDPTPNTIKPTKNGANLWQVTLNGSVNDNLANNINGASLLVKLEQQSGVGIAQTQQSATVAGNRWTINYLLDANLFDPTGAYSVTAQVQDSVGLLSNIATSIVRLDAVGPVAHLSADAANRTVISQTLTIGGVITDVNSLAGIDKLEIAYTPIEQVVALPPNLTSAEAEAQLNRTWTPVTLAQRGAGVANTTWSVAVPADLENEYQIDLRGYDLLGNVFISGNVWRGTIDTRTPRTVMTATATGATYFDTARNQQMNEIRFVCGAQDRYLNEASFVCPGEGLVEPVRSFDNNPALQALFPDYTIRTGLALSYTLWLSTTTPAASVRACDTFGRCGIASTGASAGAAAGGAVAGAAVESNAVTAAAVAPGAPKAVIVNPTNGSFVAAGNAISVTVAAEAGAGLKDVTIKLDNATVQTLNFAQSPAITRTLRTVNVPVATEGQHTLVAQATAWDNSTQTTLFPVIFTLDQNAPSLTIDASALTLADTWVAGSGVLRFNGNAGDSVGLAAVQIREGNKSFTDATFGNGTWRVALPVADPEGRTLNITVRAIDRAGRITQLNQAIATDLSAADAPDTTISSGPANPSNVNTAQFVFTGSATAAAFECSLDNGVYTPCASPTNYTDLSKGSHTFLVRAIDGRGLPDLSPATFTWTVNAGQPDATITGKPTNPTTERTAVFTFSGDATATRFECSLDGAAYATCTSPVTYNNLGNGEHTFLVRARNSANTAGAADRYIWTVTNVAPVANSQTVIVIPNQAKSITLTAIDNEPLVYTIVSPPKNGVLTGLLPNVSYSPNTNFGGADSFTFKASDGLAESNLATVTIFVDNVPPTVTCSVTPNRLWPPNHKLISIQATVTVSDLHSGPAGFTLVSVTSSEADSGLDAADVPNDRQNWVAGTPDVVGQLRAERSDAGNGRTYTLTYEGKDLANNKALCTTTVTVPKSQGGGKADYDENQVFEDAYTDPLPPPADTVSAPVSDLPLTDAQPTGGEAQTLKLFLPLVTNEAVSQ